MSKLLHFFDRLDKFMEYKELNDNRITVETGMSNGIIGKGRKRGRLSQDNISKILYTYPDLNANWLFTGKGDMLKHCDYEVVHERRISERQETRPRIPMDAAAGSLTISPDGIILSDCEQIPVIETLPKYDFTIFARGDSMETEFHSGDELACLFIKQSSFIQWGRIHVLDTTQGIIAKTIFEAGDYILCKSYNESYKEFNIHKSELFNIALVVGLIRRY